MVKKEETERISSVVRVLSTLQAMKDIALGKEREWRRDALNEHWDAITVDTCVPSDTGQWETGISKDKEKNWVIVEQYGSYEEALNGHEKWIKVMKEDPEKDLEDINLWNL